MRRSEAKQNTHKRIVQEAAHQFCREGIQAVGIAELMGQLGLTHGGFYAHFRNKEALTAEVCTEGFAQKQKALLEAVQNAPSGAELDAIIDDYLSAAQRDDPASGCVTAALGAEIARSSPEVRTAYTRGLQTFLAQLAPFLPEGASLEQGDEALVLLAGLIGTLLLARAMNNAALSDHLLQVNRTFYQRTFAR